MFSSYLRTYLNGIWAIPLVFVLRLVKPVIWIRLGTIRCDRIGHFFWESCEILNEYHEKKKSTINIYWIRKNVANTAWKKIISRQLPVRNSIEWIDKWNRKIPGGASHTLSHSHYPSNDRFGKIAQSKNKFKFSKSENRTCITWLKTMGWQKEQPIVTLLVRDSAFLEKDKTVSSYPHGVFSYHNFRDCNIEKFKSSVEWLLEKNFFVVRMGKIMKKPLDIKHDSFLDYPFCETQNDLFDIWLFANCEFCISTNSGPDLIPLYYNIPRLLVNALPLGLITRTGRDTIIPKRMTFADSGKELNLHQYLKANYLKSDDYNKANITIQENSSSENLMYVKEFVNRLGNKNIRPSRRQTKARVITQLHNTINDFQYHEYYNKNCLYSEEWLEGRDSEFFEDQSY